ncbi:MAG TPA: tripartite tricarboxylate transporter substrate binding protein [Burkholderiales bacterium]|nr:tripartite tricarboxylate transporter substrate binding protein [Burkholderiales bacterium]
MRRVAASMRRRLGVGIALLLSVIPQLHAATAAYPTKPIRLIVPFAPGGGFDVALRPLAQAVSQRLPHPIVIDNRAGAGGIVGTEIAARAAADGYTLLGGSVGLSALPSLHHKLPFDPLKDFVPITIAVASAYFLLVHPTVPAASLQELIALANKRPGELHFASAGKGSTVHLAGEMLRTMAGINIVHVPYKGAGPAMTALSGGEVALMFAPTGAALPLIKAGRLRAIGIGSRRRSALSPSTPTLSEAGLPRFEVTGWYGLLAPAGTPRHAIDKLYAESKSVLETETMRSRLEGSSLEPLGLSPEASAQFMKSDAARWARVISDAGIGKE